MQFKGCLSVDDRPHHGGGEDAPQLCDGEGAAGPAAGAGRDEDAGPAPERGQAARLLHGEGPRVPDHGVCRGRRNAAGVYMREKFEEKNKKTSVFASTEKSVLKSSIKS